MNSTCANCYALKGRYVFPNVQDALDRRLEKVENNPKWVDAMVFLISWYCTKTKVFRWHDSGDVQSLEHLLKIVEIAKRTSTIKHWLPTREVKVVFDYLKIYKQFPDNLMVRLSAPMVDGEPIKSYKYTSTVNHKTKPIGHDCPSRFQDNECRDCRACWDRKVTNVSYHKH